MTPAKILCLGDLHLGVRPSRLPAAADPEAVSAAVVWRRAVALALREGVGLVLLSGDVVDRANRYFEAFGPLEEGLGRLAEAGVEICAVGGNHDFDVLPRLSEVAGGERYRFLGAGGRWQRFTWRGRGGGARLHVDGWSFPGPNVREDPAARHDLAAPEDGAPVLGLLHGDLDAPRSTNAPIARASLERAIPAAWLLGHVHKPALIDLSGGRWALYPGSPQPLDPTEEGPHGAWLLELADGRLGRPELVPLATVRRETLEVDLSGAEDLEAAEDRLAARFRRAARELLESDRSGLALLALRARLVGRTPLHRRLDRLARRLVEETPLELRVGDALAAVGEVLTATRPPADLERLAAADDPPGLLAGLLLGLEAEAGAEPRLAPELRERLLARVRAVRDHRPYLPARREDEPADSLDGDRERERLARAAWSLLDALLAQKEARPEEAAADADRPGAPAPGSEAP